MLKNLLIIAFIVYCQTCVFGQSKKPKLKSKPPLPPKLIPLKPFKLAPKNEIEKVLSKSSPQAFAWKIVATGNIPPKTLVKESVRLDLKNIFTDFSINARIKSEYTIDSLELKKDAEIEELVLKSEAAFKDYSVTVDKNTLTLTNEKTEETERFAVFLDKDRKKIIKLQNLKNQKIYVPAEAEYPTPMIISPKRR